MLLRTERRRRELELHTARIRRAAWNYDSGRMALRICLVTPFVWSQPHDVNEHVAGVAAELRGPRTPGHRARALEPRAPTCAPGRRTLSLGARGRADRGRPRGADLAPQPHRRARRRPREPLAGARHGQVRRRARLRARPPEPLVPRAPRRPGADGGDVLRPGAPRVPARQAASASGCSDASTR